MREEEDAPPHAKTHTQTDTHTRSHTHINTYVHTHPTDEPLRWRNTSILWEPARDVTHYYVSDMRHDSFTCVPWLIDLCAMTHSLVCHDSFTCVPWLIHLCAMTYFMCATCAVTHYVCHVCHDSWLSLGALCVPWLISMCAMTHFYVFRDSFLCVCYDRWCSAPIIWEPKCDVTHYCVCHMCHDSFPWVPWLILCVPCVPWLISTCAMTGDAARPFNEVLNT